MKRFFRLFGKYALVIAAIFLAQLFPLTGIFLMFLFGFFWIGVIVHVFMIHTTILALKREIPRLVLIVPVTFYAVGIFMGLQSHLAVANWEKQQQWVRIYKQAPPGTHEIAFDGLINWIGVELDSNFQPEKQGFRLLDPPSTRLTAQGNVSAGCETHQLIVAHRCYTESKTNSPTSYLLVGRSDSCPNTPTIKSSMATILPLCSSITLVSGTKDTDLIANLSGAFVETRAYVLFPTAGCALIDNPASWGCEWFASPQWIKTYVGYVLSSNSASPNSSSILMSVLSQLRGQAALGQAAQP
jgi:hypothetical protein